MNTVTYIKIGLGLLATGTVMKLKNVIKERNHLMNMIGRASNPDNFPDEMKTFVTTMSGVLFTGSDKKSLFKKVKKNIEVAQLAEKTSGYNSPVTVTGPTGDDKSCCGSGCDKK